MSTNVLSLVVILFRRDVIWAIAATWICVSIWAASPKPAPVFVRFPISSTTVTDSWTDCGRAIYGAPSARVDIGARV